MLLIGLFVLLAAPSIAAVPLRWAPAIHEALEDLEGPGQEIALKFDRQTRGGLGLRLNEIEKLAGAGVVDLDALRRFRHRPEASKAGVPLKRLEALERSLNIFAPVIARLQRRGVTLDERARAGLDLSPLLSQALSDEAADCELRARKLAVRYASGRPLTQALSDSKEADSLINDRYPFLSDDALGRLAAVYDPQRTKNLTLIGAEESLALRDSIAAPPRKAQRKQRQRPRK